MNQLIAVNASLESSLRPDFNAIKTDLDAKNFDAAREGILEFGNRIKQLLSRVQRKPIP